MPKISAFSAWNRHDAPEGRKFIESHRKTPWVYDTVLYKRRNEIDSFFYALSVFAVFYSLFRITANGRWRLSRTHKVAREFCFAEKDYQKSIFIEARPKTEQKYLKKTYRC